MEGPYTRLKFTIIVLVLLTPHPLKTIP